MKHKGIERGFNRHGGQNGDSMQLKRVPEAKNRENGKKAEI